jgi:hypothetical protein
MLVTDQAKLIRMSVGDTRVIGRNSAGVRLFTVADNEHVVSPRGSRRARTRPKPICAKARKARSPPTIARSSATTWPTAAKETIRPNNPNHRPGLPGR